MLGHPFLATSNALLNYRNGIIRLSFSNSTLELNIFNPQRQVLGFDDIETSTLDWITYFIFDYEFDDMFATEYESFFIDNKLEYDVFEFDDLCSTSECLIASACLIPLMHRLN